MYFNKIQWAGNLGSDARSFPPSADKKKFMVSFSVAQSKPYRQGESSQASETTWLDCKGFYDQKSHDQLVHKLVKGAYVVVEGSLAIEKRVIEGVERSFPVIYLREIQFLPKPMRADDSAPQRATSSSAPVRAEEANPGAFQPANF